MAAANFYTFPTPHGQTFSLIALNMNEGQEPFIQLYPKEPDLGLNQLFVETVLSDCQAEVRADRNAPRFAQEIRVKGDYILGALALLSGEQYIDDETVDSIEARMQSVRETLPAANENRAPLQPLAEKIAAFVTENQNRLPQQYLNNLIELLQEYTSSMPLDELIEAAQGYFPQAWVKNAIATKLQPVVQSQEAPKAEEVIEERPQPPSCLLKTLECLEGLASKAALSHEEVLEALTQASIALMDYTFPAEGLPNEVQLRVEATVITISNLIPPFDFTNPEQQGLKDDIEAMWTNITSKLNLSIPCSVEMNTDFDRELAQLFGRQEENGAEGL